MNRFIDILGMAALCGVATFGQPGTASPKWAGTWKADMKESKVGKIFGRGLPAGGLTLTGQTLKISVTNGHLRFAEDTVFLELGAIHEEPDVDIDTAQGVPGGQTLIFKKVDELAFDIILSVNNALMGNNVGENHFVFSADGRTLTETKVYTEREVVPEGTDQKEGKLIRTDTRILVFRRT